MEAVINSKCREEMSFIERKDNSEIASVLAAVSLSTGSQESETSSQESEAAGSSSRSALPPPSSPLSYLKAQWPSSSDESSKTRSSSEKS